MINRGQTQRTEYSWAFVQTRIRAEPQITI